MTIPNGNRYRRHLTLHWSDQVLILPLPTFLDAKNLRVGTFIGINAMSSARSSRSSTFRYRARNAYPTPKQPIQSGDPPAEISVHVRGGLENCQTMKGLGPRGSSSLPVDGIVDSGEPPSPMSRMTGVLGMVPRFTLDRRRTGIERDSDGERGKYARIIYNGHFLMQHVGVVPFRRIVHISIPRLASPGLALMCIRPYGV